MAKKKESQEGPGDKGDQDGQGDGTKAGDGDDGTKTGDGEGDGGKKTEPQYVTPSALQGVMDAHKRSQAESQKKSDDKVDALTKTIEGLTEKLAGKSSDGDGDGEGDGSSKKKVDPEIAELNRRLKQTEDLLASEKSSRAAAEEKEENNRFEHAVKQALNEADCEKTDAAFLVIKPLLKKKDDGTPFATVTIDGGLETDVDLKTYIKRYFSEEVLPHVFKGKMRTGSPASGEGGDSGGSQGYDYTWEQVNDPDFYAANTDKVRKAIESGRVKGMPKQGAGAV